MLIKQTHLWPSHRPARLLLVESCGGREEIEGWTIFLPSSFFLYVIDGGFGVTLCVPSLLWKMRNRCLRGTHPYFISHFWLSAWSELRFSGCNCTSKQREESHAYSIRFFASPIFLKSWIFLCNLHIGKLGIIIVSLIAAAFELLRMSILASLHTCILANLHTCILAPIFVIAHLEGLGFRPLPTPSPGGVWFGAGNAPA